MSTSNASCRFTRADEDTLRFSECDGRSRCHCAPRTVLYTRYLGHWLTWEEGGIGVPALGAHGLDLLEAEALIEEAQADS